PAEDIADLLVRRDGLERTVALEAARASQHHIGLARRLAQDPETRQRRSEVLQLAAGLRGVGDAILAAGELVDLAKAEAEAMTTQRDAEERAALLRTLGIDEGARDRKSTRLNSSHVTISYAVFGLKKKREN